jgi:putative ABC transport system permease protein
MQNIFKTTYRNFARKPATNLINLLGLAVSLALVIILSVYSYSELTTDSHHKNGDRVYLFSDLLHGRVNAPAVLKTQIDLNIPEVESTVTVAGPWDKPVFQVEGRDPIESDIITADPEFFKLFTYEAVEGNLATALNEPMTVVLTEPLARKLFGKESAIGKTVKIDNKNELTVSAVIKVPTVKCALSFNAIASNASRKTIFPNDGEFEKWNFWNFQLFVLLKQGVNPDVVSARIIKLFPDYDKQKANYDWLKLNPLKQVYFSKFSLYGDAYMKCGDKKKVMILLMVAALVLMIALVNFINISSSQWIEKIKQTGVLKVIGADKGSILRNVIAEAFILFLSSLFLAIFIVQFLYPFVSNFTGIRFNPSLLYKPSFLFSSIAGVFVLSLIFSLIPAMRISSSKAVDNLKKSINSQKSKSFSRGILVTTQFTIAIVLIAFTLLVQKQVDFGSSNFGFDKENVIGIKLTPQLMAKKDVLKKIIQDNPNAGKVSFSQFFPGRLTEHWSSNQVIDGEKKEFRFDTFNGDANLLSILGLQLVQGRFYSDDLATDTHKLVVNETFVREHKLENPIGTKLMLGFGQNIPLSEIVGVVKDFHYKQVSVPIGSLLIKNEAYASYCLVSASTRDFKSLSSFVKYVKDETNKLSPSFPVEISFLDQAVENMYQSELQFRRTFSLFAGCAIVICCMGILAMSMFACQRRIKEIGIRKVNGARVSEVLAMLNRDFVKWVAIAFVIATPIAWYAMNKWLENFAYKTDLSWWIFALAGFLALGIALLTVSWQSWRAATRNPVEALRYE